MKALSKAPCDEEPLFGTVSFKMPLPAPLNGYGSGWTLPYTHAKSEDWTLTLSDPSGPQRYPGSASIAALDKEIARRAREDEVSRRLMTVPGIGPISATAIVALAPPAETVAKGRDFAAWLGFTPLQRSTGGKQGSGRHPKWANARSGAYSSLEAAPSCFRQANAAPQEARGSNRCWFANRACR